jgi:hypothetical protein
MVLRGRDGAHKVWVSLEGIQCGSQQGQTCCPLSPDGSTRTFLGTLVNHQGLWSLEHPRLCADEASSPSQ